MAENKKNSKDIPIEFLEEEGADKPQDSAKSDDDAVDASPELTESETNTSEKERQELEEIKKKYEDITEQFLRLRAEFANYKKRVDRDQIDFAEYMKGEVIKKFLPILDDFEHMLKNSGPDSDKHSVFEGARLIYDKFMSVLEEFGVKKMEVISEEFDPQIHEAMMMQPTDDESQNGKIISVFQEGYVQNGRLLRPAKVVVGQYLQPDEKN